MAADSEASYAVVIRMSGKQLAELQIRNAQSKEKTYVFGGGDGFVLEVRSNGGKYWIVRRRTSLGTYPLEDRRYVR